ncbi:MAG: ABC transporter ATP-binding protein [Burkholderiales bacterium]
MSLLVVEGLTKVFGGLRAVSNLSFSVQPGSIVGLIGPNGAGKTTAFSVIAGFQQATAGSVTFDGERITGLPPHTICHRGLTRTFQIMQSFPRLTALQNVMIGAYVRHRSVAEARSRALAVMRQLGMDSRMGELARNLTLADLKRLEIAKALATGPKLLLLDEVVSGLTPTEVDELVLLIRGIRDGGTTIVMIEHVMQAVMALSDVIVVLHHGEKIFEGAPAEAVKDRQVVEAYLGEEAMLA